MLNKNLEILDKIKDTYNLPLEVYENTRKTLKFQYENDNTEEAEFIKLLPVDLK